MAQVVSRIHESLSSTRTKFRLQVSYDVTEDLVVTFDVTNLTDEVYRQYYELPTVLNDSASIYSRTFGLGFRYI